MSHWLNLCSLGALLLGSFPQSPDTTEWNTVDQVCGKLEWVDVIAAKGKANEFHEKAKPLKKMAVRLYARGNEKDCCGGLNPLAETLTQSDGRFAFKNLTAGQYWVAVSAQGREYSLAIRYSPLPEKNVGVGAGCSGFLYQVKKNVLELGKVITVD